MRMWLLLMSLLVSGLSLSGDGDKVSDYYRKLLLNGRVTCKGPRTHPECHCMCIQRSRAYVCVQHKQRTFPFYLAHAARDDHRDSWIPRHLTEIIHWSHVPALVVSPFLEEGRSFPVMDIDSRGAGDISMEVIKDRPNSGPSWLRYHCTAASGHNFQAFSKEIQKSWAPAAMSEVIYCCLKDGETRPAMKIKKMAKHLAEPQKEGTQQATGFQVLRQYERQQSLKASVGQHDIFQTSAVHSGSSSVTNSDPSQLEIQRSAACIMKKNVHFNLDKSLQKLLPLKAAVIDDGSVVQRQILSVSGKNKGSRNRLWYELRATQDDNRGDFNGNIITKQAAELRRSEVERQRGRSRTNTVENENRERLAYTSQRDSTYKMEDNDADHKRVLTEVGEDALIMLLLPVSETQTETKVTVKADTEWKTINIPIKKPADLPPEENFITEGDNSKCTCLIEVVFPFGIYTIHRRERIVTKPAEKVTTVSEYTVNQRTEKVAPHENMNVKQSGDAPEVSVLLSPPSHTMMETEKTITEHTAQTTTINTGVKQTTAGPEVLDQNSTKTTDGLQSTEETPTSAPSPRPRFIKRTTTNTESTAEKLFSGLRMREDAPAVHGGTEERKGDMINRPKTGREENDPGGLSKTFKTIFKYMTNLRKSTDNTVPLCRGLIHRTEAGWKHCMERFTATGSKTISSGEPTAAFKGTGEPETERASVRDHDDNRLNDEEFNHFYYFDGVFKRVKNTFHTHHNSQRRRKRSHDNSENRVTPSVRGKSDNLLTYIQRLTDHDDELTKS